MDLNYLNTCVPARILEFNPVNQTATIKICLDRIYFNYDTLAKLDTYPTLTEVPVHFPQGGGWSLTFPVAAGDDCIVLFSQRGYDHWFYDGKEGDKLTSEGMPNMVQKRSFDLTDGFAIVGFNPLTSLIQTFNPDDMELRNTDTGQRVTLKANNDIELVTPTKVLIDAPATQITGTLAVDGRVTMNSGFSATGGGGSTSDLLSIANIPMETHTHTEQGDGNDVSPPH